MTSESYRTDVDFVEISVTSLTRMGCAMINAAEELATLDGYAGIITRNSGSRLLVLARRLNQLAWELGQATRRTSHVNGRGGPVGSAHE